MRLLLIDDAYWIRGACTAEVQRRLSDWIAVIDTKGQLIQVIARRRD
ncbi:hypothetical protein JQR85_01600 [Stutzerimonas urumqiensis]|nr:hypothetical protein [Stutzerimonas urumqiensis]